jgi:hypothetical protein
MRASGVHDQMIRDAFDACMDRPKRRSPKHTQRGHDGLQVGNENLIADLLRLWHRDERYLDLEANPRPLPMSKGRKNLRAMIRQLDPTADALEILQEMRSVGLISRQANAKYLPTSESAIVGKLHPLAMDHIAKLVIRLVSTVLRNVDSSERTLRLIERHAYAPDLDAEEAKAFAEFTRSQGMTYLESVDNWLEKRRIRRTKPLIRSQKSGVAASVHLFAYLGDNEARIASKMRRLTTRTHERTVAKGSTKSGKVEPTSPPATLS